MEDGVVFCSSCGNKLKLDNNKSNNDKDLRICIAALILGIIGLAAWIIPIIGLVVGVLALVLGIKGLKKSSEGMAIAGIVLGIICLIITIINGAIGVYQVFSCIKEMTEDDASTDPQEKSVFTIRDTDGNILMTNGIKSVNVVKIDGDERYAVEVTFDKKATEKFAEITSEHIDESIGIYLNDNIISNPVISCIISDGICNVVYTETDEDAKQIAAEIKKCK